MLASDAPSTEPVTGFKRPPEPGSTAASIPAKRPREDNGNGMPEAVAFPTDAALLYQLAYSSWTASSRYLVQAFLPAHVEASTPIGVQLITVPDPSMPHCSITHQPNAMAYDDALAHSIVALDALSIAARLPNLTDKERVTIGLLFGTIGFQMIRSTGSHKHRQRGSRKPTFTNAIDHAHLLADIQSELAQCVS